MSNTTPPASLQPAATAESVKAEARRLGFDLCGIAPAVGPTGFAAFREWLSRGFAGEMDYLPGRESAYEHPRAVLESVQSVVLVAMNYQTAEPPPLEPGAGRVSRYAWGSRDYHDVIRDRLRLLADFLHKLRPGCRTRIVVDTAPLLERDFARMAGLGWFGKNTMLINRRLGSWLFLAAVLTDVALDPDRPHETSHCGTCTRCLEACPTDAFPSPYVLDARRCISYLTIELDGPIPEEFRRPMGNWLFGCDICQEVCPWNRKAPESSEPAFQPSANLSAADAASLLALDEEQFRARFRNSPLWRSKRAGLLRNAAIVLGNSGDRRAISPLEAALDDIEPVLRGAAAWAIGQLGTAREIDVLRRRHLVEPEADVIREISCAIARIEDRLQESG